MEINKGDRYTININGTLGVWEVLSIVQNNKRPHTGVLFKKVKREKSCYKYTIAKPVLIFIGNRLLLSWDILYSTYKLKSLKVNNKTGESWIEVRSI